MDFSQKMIDQFASRFSNARGICSDISQFANKNKARFDKVLMKEVVHHVKEPTHFFNNVLNTLNPRGKILIVTRPKETLFPFFQKAKEEFANNQPSVDEILGSIQGNHLQTESHELDMFITIPKSRLFSMIRNRFMSTFGSFTNEEIEEGLLEVDQAHVGEKIDFNDKIILISIKKQ